MSRRSVRPLNPLLKGILAEAGIVALLCLTALVGLRVANSRMGLDESLEEQESLAGDLPAADSLQYGTSIEAPGIEGPPEGPEAGWPVTPCSLFVSASSTAVLDSLPEAQSPEDMPYETMLLVSAWARLSGLGETDLARVYTFNTHDTLFVDLPAPLDLQGLARTLEGRLVCYTVLFPLVSGSPHAGYPDGIPLRGVPGTLPD